MSLTDQMDRDEALQRIKTPELDESFLKQEFEYIAHKLDLTVEELQDIFEGPNKSSSDYKNKMGLINIAAKAQSMLGFENRLYK